MAGISGGGVSDDTIQPAADTAAGDSAALGYTATEGIIITGQGTTNDVTIKNDADTEVLGVLTGSTRLAMAGTLEPSRTQAVSNGALETGVTAVYYGDGIRTTAVLTLTNLAMTVGNSANLGTGVLVFTLPAGDLTIEHAAMDIQIAGVSTTTDTPDIGLGTVIGSGVVTVLGGTSTFENIISGVAATDTNGTTTVAHGSTNFSILTGAAHTVYFNAADAWGANADTSATVSGTIVLVYRYNFA